MAKKKRTRQEKIIASLRREIQSASQFREPLQKENNNGIAPTQYTLPKTTKIKIVEEKNLEMPTNNFLKRDLTKTFILSILAISLELMIYFLSG